MSGLHFLRVVIFYVSISINKAHGLYISQFTLLLVSQTVVVVLILIFFDSVWLGGHVHSERFACPFYACPTLCLWALYGRVFRTTVFKYSLLEPLAHFVLGRHMSKWKNRL